ncbi:hypothetical protein HNP84_002713 [Thermocatellispora tengchongensis]|uniref:Uncharacterized protein n=1 Tax=Thermocatellispora tengchongensis TaxID=1073253 RepID=A0A840P0T5_9ACTN|nr:hypothetical protein [Thermocatellispora tengchongensis]MBB5132992.1 hypothetical protein [Thermocatellispora tengchongensis]
MRFTFGRRGLPAGVELAKGDRALTYAKAAGGGHVVVTDNALYLDDGTRLPWHTIDRGLWDEDGITVITTDGGRHRALLPDPGRVPEAVRERVTSSIVVNQHVPLPGRGGVRLVARRVPGQPELLWEFVFDQGLDPDDPGLRAHAEQALEEVRRSLGV